MARIKKDQTHWGGRRQYAKAFVTPPEETKHSSKKNTRKWCRGKPGKLHKPVKILTGLRWFSFYWACATCGKHYIDKPKDK